MGDKTLIDYTDEAVLERQNIAPNAACDIDGAFYDIRNLVFLARVQADALAEAERKLAKAVEALEECVEEIDAYIQHQYPHDHPVQERHRQQDYASNPARLALAELTGGKDE